MHAFQDPLLDAEPVAMLDLHGFTKAEAAPALLNFIATWRRRASGRVVHIVTGKGRGSSARSVLKPTVRRMLKEKLTDSIKEWSRDLDDGGYLVLLR